MAKAAVIILAGNDTHADKGRLVNGLQTAREFKQTPGDEVRLIFDGAGTEWIPVLEDPDNQLHGLYASLREDAGVCDYCAGAFHVEDAVADADVITLDEHHGHPSIRSLVSEGYDVITF